MATPDARDPRVLVRAFEVAKAAGDVNAMAAAALALSSGRVFGTHPGRGPAFLHEAYLLSHGRTRTRLAIELTKAWVYGGDAGRATGFAKEAVADAELAGDAALLAAALDAELLVHWGPDDLAERLRITARLDDVVAHLAEEEPRLSVHLWRLTTALECLDTTTARRQVRALERLAAETERARTLFLALSRSAMFALLTGDDARAAELAAQAVAAGREAAEPDSEALHHSLRSELARHRGDLDTLREEAAAYEEFGFAEGVPSVAAEGAVFWCEVADLDRAASIVRRLAGAGLDAVARDVDWLLTVTSLGRAAALAGVHEVAEEAVELLTPYAGRGVVNAGAVNFSGVVDDHLAVACGALGRRDEAAKWRERAARAYDRLEASWLRARLRLHPAAPAGAPVPAATRAVLRPEPGGIWSVGLGGAVTPLRAMKGFEYLRILLASPETEIGAAQLSDAVAGHAVGGVQDASYDELIDRQALAAYRARLSDLDQELDEASSWSDEERRARLTVEREALLGEVRAASGLGGRTRRTSSSAERARVAVRKAIAAALERIELANPALGRVLTDSIETGTSCRYHPDPGRPIEWVLR